MAERKKILETIEVPEGIKAELDEDMIRLSKNGDMLEKRLDYKAELKDRKIILGCEKPTKRDKKLIKTTSALIKNMISGLEKKYVYKLQICSVHFPMHVSVSGNEVIIKNFLGEVRERRAKILPGVEVKVEKDIVGVSSSDKEKAGQTAANIEKATKIRKRDRRIFQDGIWMVSKEKGRRRR